MRKILAIKPIVLFLLFIVLLFVTIRVAIFIINIEFEKNIFYVVHISVIIFIAYFFFWIYVLGCGFNELDKKTGNDLQIKKFKLFVVSAFFSITIILLINTDFIFNEQKKVPEYISNLLSLIFFYFYMLIIIKLTKNYKFYETKEIPRIFDYFATMFLLSLFPFGLLIMHSHLRLLLKDRNII